MLLLRQLVSLILLSFFLVACNAGSGTDEVDTTPPIIQIGSPSTSIAEGESFVDDVSASDDIDGNITSNTVTTGTVDTHTAGTYTLKYNVKDAAENEAVEVIRTVIVTATEALDTTQPVINIGSASVTLVEGTDFVEDVTASDNKDGDITANIVTTSSLDTSQPRIYILKYNVKDQAGNTAIEVIRRVIVTAAPDTTPPVINIGSASVTLVEGTDFVDDVTASDNKDGDITANIVTTSSLDTSQPRIYILKYNVKDQAGNTAIEVIRRVIVTAAPDTTPPVISIGSASVTLVVGTVFVDDVTASDNKDGDITANIVITGSVDTSKSGTYTLKYNVKDRAKNAAVEVVRTVTVVEIEGPDLIPHTVQNDIGNSKKQINHDIAMDINGNAMSVWQQDDGTVDNLWASYYSKTLGWGEPKLIEVGNGTAGRPKVSFDKSGNAIVVWKQKTGGNYQVFSNRYNPLTGWGSEQILGSEEASISSDPNIAMDDAGNALVVWRRVVSNSNPPNSTESQSFIMTARFDALQDTWQGPLKVGDGGLVGGVLSTPQVSMNTKGDAAVIWRVHSQLHESFIGPRVYVSRFDKSSGWAKHRDINLRRYVIDSDLIFEGGDYGFVSIMLFDNWHIGIDDSQNILVAGLAAFWIPNQYSFGTFSRVYKPRAGWGTPSHFIEDYEGKGYHGGLGDPHSNFSMNKQGEALFVVDTETKIDVYCYSPATGWGAKIVIADGADYKFFPSVSLDDAGSAIVSWLEWVGRNTVLFTRRYKNNQWGALNKPATHKTHRSAQLATNSAGLAMVQWTEINKTNQLDLRARLFLLK